MSLDVFIKLSRLVIILKNKECCFNAVDLFIYHTCLYLLQKLNTVKNLIFCNYKQIKFTGLAMLLSVSTFEKIKVKQKKYFYFKLVVFSCHKVAGNGLKKYTS